MKVIIAEDERLAREELTYLLEKEEDIILLPCAANGRELLEAVDRQEPDVIFLDIQMPEMNGIQAAKMLRSRREELIIVFTSAYEDYAVKAFELNAVDYLLKPYSHLRLKETLGRIRGRLDKDAEDFSNEKHPSSAKLNKLLIDDGEKLFVIDPESILYAEKEEKVVRLYTMNNQSLLSRYTLQELEEKLQNFSFFRPHRSYLVNLNHIDELIPWFNGTYNLILKDTKRTKIPVSRFSAKELFKLLTRN